MKNLIMKNLIKISFIIACINFIGLTADQKINSRYNYNYRTVNTALNLRENPSGESNILFVMNPHTPFKLIEKNENWSLINLTVKGQSYQGYAFNKYLSYQTYKPSDLIFLIWLILHLTSLFYFIHINRDSGYSFLYLAKLKWASPLLFIQLPRKWLIMLSRRLFRFKKLKTA